MRNHDRIAVVVLVSVLLFIAAVQGIAGPRNPTGEEDRLGVRSSLDRDDFQRDFMFQVENYRTQNQGGQTLNMYFHYRYDDSIANEDIPNYEDLRSDALEFMADVDASENPFWEVLNQQLCTELMSDYPIQAISCQLQVYPDYRPGLPYEPGFHGSVHTIGDIEPLAIPGPIEEPINPPS